MARMDNHRLQLEAKRLVISLKFLSLFVVFILFFIGLSLFPSHAAHQGGEVVAGDITITNPTDSQTLINQTTQSGIINWQSFSIGSGEHTHFNQPSASSVTLNRVIGPDASSILGRLSATGIIMLVNQAGIFFGQGSVVDVAGLIATTSNITNADFLAGTYRFLQAGNPTASIIAKGQINVVQEGMVALMAPGVEHTGVITANLGKVVLASVAPETSYVVDLYGDSLVHFSVRNELVNAPRDQNNQEMNAAVSNRGAIYAHGGKVLLTARAARDVVHSVINTSGIIEANTVSERHGEIYLDAGDQGTTRVAGTLRARGEEPGETGGNITVLGDTILIAENEPAILDVSGASGGGEIFIGGGFQGGGTLPHSTVTYIGSEAQLFANALIEGEGGQIVAWSDGYTGAHGAFEAMGGVLGGSGGLIETSGHYLTVAGIQVNTTAPYGETGIWLLDPWDIEISTSSTQGGSWDGGDWIPDGDPDPSIVNITDLVSHLGSSNVVIDTNANLIDPGEDVGNISVMNAITWSGTTNSLTLIANTDIYLYANINGSGSLTLQAGNRIDLFNPITLTAANVSITAGTAVVGDSNNLTINVGSGNIDFTVATGIGTLTFNSTGITTIPEAIIDTASLITNAGGETHIGASITTTGSQTYNDAVILTNGVTLASTGAGNIVFGASSTVNGANTLTLNTTGTTAISGVIGGGTPISSLTTNAGGTTNIGADITTTGNQTYGDAISLTGNAVLTGANFNPSGAITGGGNDLELSFSGESIDISANTIEGVAFTNLGTLSSTGAGGTSLTGTVDEADAFVFNNAVTLTDDTTLTSLVGSGTITFGASSTVNSEAVEYNTLTLDTTGAATINGEIGGTRELSSLTIGGIAAIGADITTTGDQNYNGFISLTSGVVLTGANFNPSVLIMSSGGARDLTLNFSEQIDILFNSIEGTSFNGIKTLTISGAGGTSLTGTINQADSYVFNNAVTLAGNTTLASSGTGTGDITFGATSTVNGANTLTLNTTGTTTISGVIGGGTPISSLTTNAGGTTNIGANITTSGTQTYNDAVTLTAEPINLTGSTVSFSGAGATITGGSNALTITGNADFDGVVSGLTTLNVTGTSDIGANITSSGTQTYNDAVTLTASPVILTGTTMNFQSTITGGTNNLIVTGNADFDGIVSGLGTLNVTGTSDIGADITTAGAQTYGDAIGDVIELTDDAILTSTGGLITFNSTIDSAAGSNLTVATPFSDITIAYAIGGTNPIGDLDLNSAGNIDIGANITTTGSQTYQDELNLTSDVVLTGTSFVPLDNIEGGGKNLTLNFSGDTDITNTTINTASFLNVGAITTGGGGTTNLSGAVIDAFTSQTYNDAVVLANDISLSTAGTGNITFGGTVSGAGLDLTLNTGGANDIIFQSGTANRLDAITVTNTRNFTISGGTVSGTTFDLTGTGTADFGNTLNVTGYATVRAYNAYGEINVGGLGLETTYALRPGTLNDGLTGFVAGLSGELGARAIDVLNTIGPGTHFFDGIDLFTFASPVNPPGILPSYPDILNEGEDVESIIDQAEGPFDLIMIQPSAEMPDSCAQSFSGKSQFDLPCAEAMLKLNKPHVAMMLFNRVLTRNPQSFRARIGLIKAYVQLGMYDEAKEELIILRDHVKSPASLKIINRIINSL